MNPDTPSRCQSEPGDQPLQRYLKELEAQKEIVRLNASRWSSVGFLRGSLFLLSLVPLFLALNSVAGVSVPWVILAGICFLTFLVVAYIHEGMQLKLRIGRLKVNMNSESVARIKRDWPAIPTADIEVDSSDAATSFDLDLFGASSLFKLIGITRTPLGTSKLKDWLLDGALPEEVRERQVAVAELVPHREWRNKFQLTCEQLAASQSGPTRFIEWCESENWFARRQWLLWTSRVIGLISVAAIIAMLFSLLPLTVVGPVLLVTLALNFILSVIHAGSIHDVFNSISSRTDEINHYVSLFNGVADYPAESKRLKEIQERMLVGGTDARKQINSLGLFVWLANLRRNGIFFLIYLVFEFLFFWDVHVLDLLEKWKEKHGAKARGWFDDLGQWEALCALAKLADDNPDWVFPAVEKPESKSQAKIVCEELGHPLMDDSRVANDVSVGPAGTVLLVSGSNMSGKSTLLRSVGVNVVLAQMGSVVCAKSMSLAPLHIETSMRIVDSLADGVSFFMAELKRLKEIVDQGKRYNSDPDRAMLFLLDEILQGTNSRERQIAVSRVVRKLIDENAIGAISTHDLDLATTSELEKACQSVHFSEQFIDTPDGRKMTFDYHMRQGIAETTNALKLLELVGLGE